VSQQDQKVGLKVDGFCHLVKEFLGSGIVLQFGLAQLGQQGVVGTLRHLFGGEGEVRQVLSAGTGKDLLQYAKELFLFIVQHQGNGLGKLGELLSLIIEVTAPNGCNIGPIGTKTPSELGNFSFVHGCLRKFGICIIAQEKFSVKTFGCQVFLLDIRGEIWYSVRAVK